VRKGNSSDVSAVLCLDDFHVCHISLGSISATLSHKSGMIEIEQDLVSTLCSRFLLCALSTLDFGSNMKSTSSIPLDEPASVSFMTFTNIVSVDVDGEGAQGRTSLEYIATIDAYLLALISAAYYRFCHMFRSLPNDIGVCISDDQVRPK
jgi:hypothetical protein